jgi:hypothetical protein
VPLGVLEPVRPRRRPPRLGRILRILVALAALAGAAAAVAFLVRPLVSGEDRQHQERRIAREYAADWQRGDYAAMFALLADSERARVGLDRFRAAYADATRLATVDAVRARVVQRPNADTLRLRVTMDTRLFRSQSGGFALRFGGKGDGFGLLWSPRMTFPKLRPGEALSRKPLPAGAPESVYAADGSRLGGLDAQFPQWAPAGTLGRLVKESGAILRGRPGSILLAGTRQLAHRGPVEPRPLRTTLVPRIQQAAVEALGDQYGGIAVIRVSDGAVVALAGIASSSPQPPGSTFKIVTASAALTAHLTTLETSYPAERFATVYGLKLPNAHDELCGGTLIASFANSCNSVFAPLGARVGAKRLVNAAHRFGFGEEPRVPFAAVSAIPTAAAIGDQAAVAASAIGQGKVTATPLQMASVAATIAAHGKRARPRLLTIQKPRYSRAVSPAVAAQVATMMRAVVTSGTGTAAAIPGVDVAGKTGTAELHGGPRSDDTDAWFAAYAPAAAPRYAVGVLVVAGGFGGDAAAPLARRVLEAALGV